MKHAWTLTKIRMRLALRAPAFLFFSIIMPIAYLFFYIGVFGRGNLRAVSYMFAAVLALTVMGGFWGLSVQLVIYREQGILRRFRLAPVGPGAMLVSSIASNYILTLPTIAAEFALARWFFHMEQWGNLWSTWVLVSVGIVCFATLGLIVASVANTMQETQVICNAIWFALLFLSGATIPLPILPGWIQQVAVFLPATYLVTGLQRVLLRGAPVWHLGPELLALAGCAVLAFLISVQLFRWEPEAKVSRRAKAWAAATVIPFLLLGAWESAHGNIRSDARVDFQSLERRPPAENPK